MNKFNNMNAKRLSLATILLASILSFSSCNNEPVDSVLAAQLAANNSNTGGGGTTGGGGSTVLPPLNGTSSLTIDTTPITANQITATRARQVTPSGDIISYSLAIANVDTSNPMNSKIVTIQFENISGNSTYNLGPVDLASGGSGLMSYITDLNNPATSTYSSTNLALPGSSTATGVVNVTSNDLVTRTFSGNFSGSLFLNELGTGVLLGTKSVSNGLFTNVHYKIYSPTQFAVKLNSVDFSQDGATTSLENGTLTIEAENSTGDSSVILEINTTTGVGTYNVSSTSNYNTIKGAYNSNGTITSAQTGSITIVTKTANRIAGTFSFTTSGSNSFSQGSFDLEY